MEESKVKLVSTRTVYYILLRRRGATSSSVRPLYRLGRYEREDSFCFSRSFVTLFLFVCSTSLVKSKK